MKDSIFLLEDNPIQNDAFSEIIQNTLLINEYEIDFQRYQEVPANIDQILNNIDFGVFYLDMEIGEDKQAGLNLAVKIRNVIPTAYIIFITTHSELSLLTLERKISPYDFIVKDKGIGEIKRKIIEDTEAALNAVKSNVSQSPEFFHYLVNSKYYFLPMSDLILLKTERDNPGIVTLISKEEEAMFPSNLNLIEKEFPTLFRSDRSYLVNLDNMMQYDRKNRIIEFIQGHEAKVSTRKTKILLDRINSQ